MATLKSPTPSSSTTSEVERLTQGRHRVPSNTSHETQQTASHHDQNSVRNAGHLASIGETNTVQSNASAVSLSSVGATGTPYDAVSLAASMNTGFTGMTGSKPQSAASIPIIAPPSLRSESQQPIRVDVASAHQHYQQHAVQPEISPSTGSTMSSSGTSSLSSPGSASVAHQHQHQPHYHSAQTTVNQLQSHQNNSVSQQYVHQWPQENRHGGPQHHAQQQQQQQWTNQFGGNAFAAADDYRDGVLHIDYGAIEAYNIALQSSDEFVNSLVPPQGMRASGQQAHFDAAKALFNQVDVNHDGSISREEFRQWAAGGQQPHFDAAKALFNQVDVNHDGSISRDEFNQWAVGGQQYSQSYGNDFQTTGGATLNANSYSSGTPADIADVLRQSGLGAV